MQKKRCRKWKKYTYKKSWVDGEIKYGNDSLKKNWQILIVSKKALEKNIWDLLMTPFQSFFCVRLENVFTSVDFINRNFF